MPTNSNEIIMQEDNAIIQEVGSEIELTFENITKKYKLVGIASNLDLGTAGEINAYDIINTKVKAVTILKREELKDDNIVNVSILTNNIKNIYETTENLIQKLNLEIISKSDKNIEKNDTDISEKLNNIMTSIKQDTSEPNIGENKNSNIIYNTELLNFEMVLNESSSFKSMLIKIGTIFGIIIIFISFITIYRTFKLNYEEMAKEFAIFSSIGATKKQIKEVILKRNTILGIIGIAIGIAVGVIFAYLLLLILGSLINNILNGSIDFRIGDNFYNIIVDRNIKLELILPFKLLLIIVIIIYMIILISSILPMKQLKKASLIEVIKIKNSKPKKFIMTNIIDKIFGITGVLAYKNIKRKKLNYRTIIISITASICVLLVTSGFIDNLYEKFYKIFPDKKYDDYRIEVSYEKIEEVINYLKEKKLIKEYCISCKETNFENTIPDQETLKQASQERFGHIDINLTTDNAYEIDNKIEELRNKFGGYGISGTNVYAQKLSIKSGQSIINIVLYSFSIMIFIFSVINIFDTIMANMILRKKEFFMLHSIGMEKRQIKKMLFIEGIFYGTIAIICSIIISIVLLYILNYCIKGKDIKLPWINMLYIIPVVYIAIYVLTKLNRCNMKSI